MNERIKDYVQQIKEFDESLNFRRITTPCQLENILDAMNSIYEYVCFNENANINELLISEYIKELCNLAEIFEPINRDTYNEISSDLLLPYDILKYCVSNEKMNVFREYIDEELINRISQDRENWLRKARKCLRRRKRNEK